MGIETSITATSGDCSMASRQAASPSAASPTTSMSGWASIRERRPDRTTLWSSARTMRILTGMAGILPVGVDGYACSDGCPLALCRLDQQRAAHQADALAHAEQPQVRAVGPGAGLDRLGVEPPA